MNQTATETPETWETIKNSIDELNRPELEKRYWQLHDEMTKLPLKDHGEIWEKELIYMYNRLNS